MPAPTRIVLALALFALPALAGCLAVDGPVGGAGASTGPTTREFDLYVAAVTREPRPGVVLPGLAFGLSPEGPFTVPGPEIRVTEGDRVIVRLHDGWHTVHWHGVVVPWEMDGVPGVTQGVGPGVFTYDFVARDPGTFWYHCHVFAPGHVDEGMFGAFIVEPRDPSADRPFHREATLFLHEDDSTSSDLEHAANGDPASVRAPPNAGRTPDYAARNLARLHHAAGRHVDDATNYALPFQPGEDGYLPRYDVFMINGKSFPDTEPVVVTSGETLRLRLVNAGQFPHTIHLHGHRGLVTHKDGAPLASPYLADTIGLFPGERYDVYVAADNAGMWDLHDHGGGHYGAFASNDGWFPGGMNTMLVYSDFAERELPVPVEGATSGDLRAALAGRHRH